MSRLDCLQGHELAIQTVSEELDFLKRHLASGGEIDSEDMQDLSKCLKRLQQILDGYQDQAIEAWQDDREPLPSWLQPRQSKSGPEKEEPEEPGSAVA